MLSHLIIFTFTFWIASDFLALPLLRALRPRDRGERLEAFCLSRGLGPIVISWIFYHLLLIAPGRPPALYAVTVFALIGGAGFAGRSEILVLRRCYADLGDMARALHTLRTRALVLLGLTAAVAVLILVVGVGFPIVEGDALGFAVEARLIHRDLSFAHYPTLAADPATGYFYDTFQIPCLQVLYAWFFLLLGGSAVDILPRTVAPVFALYAVALLAAVLWRRSRSAEAALWGALAFISTPVFTTHSYLNTQDPHRLFFSLGVLVVLTAVLRSAEWRLAFLLGIFAGLAIYCHILGIVALAVVAVLYLWLSPVGRGAKVGVVSLVVVVGLSVGGVDYYARPAVRQRLWLQFPAVARLMATVSPGSKPAAVPQEAFPSDQRVYDWMATRRGQEGAVSRFVFSKLQVFTAVEWFGVLFWLFLIAAVRWWRQPEHTDLDRVMMGAIAIYAVIVLSDVRVMASSNPRYIGTAVPLAAYFVAGLLGDAPPRAGARGGARTSAVAAIAMAVLFFPLIATTAVRGAKVGLTNPGNMLAKLHSPQWVGTVARHPLRVVAKTWKHYLGVRQTLTYLFASDEAKREHAHDFFTAVDYMSCCTPAGATAIVIGRETSYFYYAHRTGVSGWDPRLAPFYQEDDPAAGCRALRGIGVDHVVIDSYYASHPQAADSALAGIMADRQLSEQVFEHGTARVYRLRCEGG